jgi:hypothetical protein
MQAFSSDLSIDQEPMLLDMARSAAIGRDAFVDPKTSVASYYWQAMNRGAGPYPHHAWWQIGWITDYLMSEAELRSNGRDFFPTRICELQNVRASSNVWFTNGNIFGEPAQLV